MSADATASPLRVTFDVDCPPDHAFDVWVTRISTWWPRDHTISGDPKSVVLQPGIGGRIFERTRDDTEHEWGQVTAWEPPTSLAFRWHIGRGPETATDVTVRFLPVGAATRIEIEQRGWERLGTDATIMRERNRTGWSSIAPHFAAAIHEGAL